MTCIVGVRDPVNCRVIIGGDSAACGPGIVLIRTDPKVFRVGPYAIGFTDSWRMGQILRYGMRWPEPPARNGMRHVVRMVVPAIREAFKREGWMGQAQGDEIGRERGGEFLCAFSANLYMVDSDFQVAELSHDYASVGYAREFALGSLHSTSGMQPRKRALMALQAASVHGYNICPPFRFVHT